MSILSESLKSKLQHDPELNAVMFGENAPCDTARLNFCIAFAKKNDHGVAEFTPDCEAWMTRCKARKLSVDPGAYRWYLDEEEEIWNASMALEDGLPEKHLRIGVSSYYIEGRPREDGKWPEIFVRRPNGDEDWKPDEFLLDFEIKVTERAIVGEWDDITMWDITMHFVKYSYNYEVERFEPLFEQRFSSGVEAKRCFFDKLEKAIPLMNPKSAEFDVNYGDDYSFHDGPRVKDARSRLSLAVTKLITTFKPPNA